MNRDPGLQNDEKPRKISLTAEFLGELVQAVSDGTLKCAIDEAVDYEPDLMV